MKRRQSDPSSAHGCMRGVLRGVLLASVLSSACAEEPELPPPTSAPPEAEQRATRTVAETQPIAVVAGKLRRGTLPFYATDLGWAFAHGQELWLLFGDTWKSWMADSFDPKADDTLGKISLKDFPDGDSVERWLAAHPAPARAARWNAEGPPVQVVTSASGKPAPLRPVQAGKPLTSGPALTPMAGFSNARSGEQAGAFGLFLRNEPVVCDARGACADGFECDTGLGQCAPLNDLSMPCVLGTTSCNCTRIGTGLCQDRTSSVYDASSERGRSHAVLMRQQVGNAVHGDEASFASQPWETRRFYNVTVRTVRDFDASRPGGAGNDYAPADGRQVGRDGVFLWGRPNFGGVGALDRDAQLYLAWVPMPEYESRGQFRFQPRYYAGLDAEGRPRFVEREVDAQPLDLDARTPGEQPHEVHDIVGQTSVSWLPSLKRFVMLYGGSIPGAFTKLIFGADQRVLEPDPQGPIFMRFAEHPWGPWSAPEPLLIAGDPEQGAVEQYGPGGILYHSRCRQQTCAQRELALFGQLGNGGHLYAPSIVEPWTEAREGGAVDLYWHVSTWNPYQIVLMKTRLRALP